MANDYRLGRIIGAYLRSRKGKRELHPAVIISGDAEIVQPEHFDPRRHAGSDNVVVVVGVSTKFKLYPDAYVTLPFQRSGHAQTQLTQECAAIIGWYDRVVIPDECQFFAGDVPRPILNDLLRRTRDDIRRRIGREFQTLAEAMPLLF